MDKLNVISKGHTLSALKKRGISKRPVPMNLLFDVKYHPDGTVDKYKVRCVQAVHKGHLQRGRDFFNTFSAASRSCQPWELSIPPMYAMGIRLSDLAG